MTCPECNQGKWTDSEAIGKLVCPECKSTFISCLDRETGIPELKSFKDIKFSAYIFQSRKDRAEIKFDASQKYDEAPDFAQVDPKTQVSKPTPFCPNYYVSDIHVVGDCKLCQELLKDWKDGQICSFCQKIVPNILISEGTAQMRMKVEQTITSVDPLVIEEHVKISAPKVVACPDCSRKIKPMIDRDGRITNQNVKTYSAG